MTSLTAEQLRRSLLGGGVAMPAYLRKYRGKVWTVQTNGHALLAVRGRLTENIEGPHMRLRNLGPFKRVPRVFDIVKLREFLSRPRPIVGDRGGELSIAKAGSDDALADDAWTYFEDRYFWPDGGYVDASVSRECIRRGFRKWREAGHP